MDYELLTMDYELLTMHFLQPSPHAPEAQQDEGDAEELAHIEEHAVLEVHLVLLGIFDENAAGEYHEEAEAEEEARADQARTAAVDVPSYEEETSIAEGFVELAGMARQLVHALEDEGPGQIGGTAYYLAVHQVAQADGTGADGGDDAHIIQHMEQGQAYAPCIEHQGQHKAQCAAVAGQALVARHHPMRAVVARGKPHEPGSPQLGARRFLDGQEHLGKVVQIVVGLVEQAVTQPGTHQDAHEAVEEHGVELVLAQLLLLIEPVHEHIY